MKRKYFIIIGFFMCICASYSQEKSSGTTILLTEPNGVVVHKPVDVEQTLGINPPSQEKETLSRTIDDFSVEEMEDMLFYIDLKSEKIKEEDGSVEDIKYYNEQKILVEEKLKAKRSKQ